MAEWSPRTPVRWSGEQRGSVAAVMAYAERVGSLRLAFLRAFATEVRRLCAQLGIDWRVVVAHSDVETGDRRTGAGWRSPIWAERGNPGGIGVTDGPDLGIGFVTGESAARGMVAHYVAYIYGDGWTTVWGETPPWPWDWDPRWNDVPDAWRGTVRTIGDMQGKWWTSPTGAANVAAAAQTIFGPYEEGPTVPTAVTFGRVPHPAMTIRDIPENRAWDDLGPRTIRAVVWHRMLGSLWGTDSYFRGEAVTRALTDYGVGVAAQDGAAHDGEILRWNDPRGRRAPWANGPVSDPYGDGKAFVDRYGVAAVNRDCVSIEISGMQTTPLSEASRDAIASLTAYYADRSRVPWATFPAVPGEDRSFVIWHREFTIGTGKECPFAVVMDETDALIAQTKAILKRYQTDATPTTTTTPAPQPVQLPPGLSLGVARELYNPRAVRDPVSGMVVAFNLDGEIPRRWLSDGLAAIPPGGRWDDGDEWRSLDTIVRRGDGRLVWVFGGRVYQVSGV
jgi:hypothetical protein